MVVENVSTLDYVSTSNRLGIQKHQVAVAQRELLTGRKDTAALSADILARSLDLDIRITSLDGQITLSTLQKSHLQTTEAALSALEPIIDQYRGALISARNGGIDLDKLADSAAEILKSVSDVLNTSQSGKYLFGGINGDQRPLKGEPLGTVLSSAIVESFKGTYGHLPDEVVTRGISADSLSAWLSSHVASLFDGSAWFENVSNAVDARPGSLTTVDRVAGKVSVNESAFRDLIMSLSSVASLKGADLGDDAKRCLLDLTSRRLEAGAVGLNVIRSQVGQSIGSLEIRSTRLAIEKDMLALEVGSLRDADPLEASLRVESLRTKLEASYEVTARLSKLSLVHFV